VSSSTYKSSKKKTLTRLESKMPTTKKVYLNQVHTRLGLPHTETAYLESAEKLGSYVTIETPITKSYITGLTQVQIKNALEGQKEVDAVEDFGSEHSAQTSRMSLGNAEDLANAAAISGRQKGAMYIVLETVAFQKSIQMPFDELIESAGLTDQVSALGLGNGIQLNSVASMLAFMPKEPRQLLALEPRKGSQRLLSGDS